METEYSYLNRFLLFEPLCYTDNIHLMTKIDIIVTDSGGIQEEGVSIGKPVFILRDTTERPEGVMSGSAKLIGTSADSIFNQIYSVLKNQTLLQIMSQPHFVYGDGTASEKIVNILADSMLEKPKEIVSPQISHRCYDLIIALTVWKRDTLSIQLERIYSQTILGFTSVAIIIYQNSHHLNISSSLEFWKNKFASRSIPIIHIHSSIETGYFGRFLSPLMVESCPNGVFIINDDDILFGQKYYENMIRVVNEGFLCTRNGRVVRKTNTGFDEFSHSIDMSEIPVIYNHDISCDFGGHIWAGKIEWLRIAWQNPPLTIANCEDFWLSAVLKTKLGIQTKIPRCPHQPDSHIFNPEPCACSMKIAMKHDNAVIGNQKAKHDQRISIILELSHFLNYQFLEETSPKDFLIFLNEPMKRNIAIGNNSWTSDCLYWD